MVLRALILVGGYGTRLRPLTFTKPKPLTEFINKPIVLHQIEALVAVGVKEIILAVSYHAKKLETELSHLAQKLNIKVIFSLEKEPLGTAGPIKLAEKYLDPNDPDPFFMLNADVISDFHLDALLKFHKTHLKEGSIYVTPVKDPSRYGVVVGDEKTGEISAFVEKPKELKYGNLINAGLYLFNKTIINRVPNRPCSIEREIFPQMAKDKNLYRLRLNGYWMDVGKPDDFITGQKLYLDAVAERNDKRLWPRSDRIIGNVIIDESAKISLTATIGPNVVIGPNAIICANARVRDSCIMEGTIIRDAAYVSGSIIGWKSDIGKWSRLQDLCILGEDVKIQNEVMLVNTTVCPHKIVKDSSLEKGKIIL